MVHEWILSEAILDYTKLVITWDSIQFEENSHHQKYEESDESITYLQTNTVKQLIGLRNSMILLITQNRPADQRKCLLFHLG